MNQDDKKKEELGTASDGTGLGGLDYQFGLPTSDLQPLGLDANGQSELPDETMNTVAFLRTDASSSTNDATTPRSVTKLIQFPRVNSPTQSEPVKEKPNPQNLSSKTDQTYSSVFENDNNSSNRTTNLPSKIENRTNFQRLTSGELPTTGSGGAGVTLPGPVPIMIFIGAVVVIIMVPIFFGNSQRNDFDRAMRIKNWAQSKAAMREAITTAISKEKSNSPSTFINDELVEYGDKLVEHGEYKDALKVWDECSARPTTGAQWKLTVALHRGLTEKQLARVDKNFQPNIPALITNVEQADRVGNRNDKGKLLQLLGAISYDQHKDAEGDQYFQRAEKELPLEKTKEHRRFYEAWWDARMHQTIEKLKLLPKPRPTKLTLQHQDDLLENKANYLLTSQKFDELTKLFENEEQNRKLGWGGGESVDDLYSIADVDKTLPEAKWTERKDLLLKWAAAEPNSPIPHMVLAEFYDNYAWLARSGSRLGDLEFALFKSRLLDGERELNKALDWKNVAPEWFTIAQTNFLGGTTGKGNKPDYDALYSIGMADYPNRARIQTSKSWFLQPRWYGDEDEWVTFVTDAANKVGGEAGDKLYCRLVYYNMDTYKNVWKEFPNLDQVRYNRGYKLLEKDYPEVK